ncbi:MAG: mechanosensitive ion channel [Gammaproteobacteria bacterium]|nr:mechanosensitive ion channel [Gammaproteobacteria bacterium]
MDETSIAIYLQRGEDLLQRTLEYAVSPSFYAQIGLIFVAVLLAYFVAGVARRFTRHMLQEDRISLTSVKRFVGVASEMLNPFLNILLLMITVDVSQSWLGESWLVRIGQSMAIVWLLYMVNARFVRSYYVKMFVKWVVIPIALLAALGWLTPVTGYLESISLELGNIQISVYGIVRMLVFGAVLFWLGRVSNSAGQKIIRNQEALDAGTKEVFAKLFQVVVIAGVFILLLQLMGINLTALAVFSGAVGVGLGFGLQSIASNFISGVIILLDRSLTVGDYVEMEDGRAGIIRELNMRSAVLETFDGKDIMVPNEKFITTEFINWTHKNNKQRYTIEFSVAYDTDFDTLFDLIRGVVAAHPKVLSGDHVDVEERPDCEIKDFGDSGINILVEYWMEGIDDGRNRVGADLNYMILQALRAHDIVIPFPQREVRMLNGYAK